MGRCGQVSAHMENTTLADFQTFDCPDCSKSFDTSRGLSVHHTKMHDGSVGGKVTLECEVCGDEFEKWESHVRREKGEGKHCSKECLAKAQKTGETRKCKVCGDEFYRPDCHLNRGRGGEQEGSFCSPECAIEWRVSTGALRGENHPMWKGGHSLVGRAKTQLSNQSWPNIAADYREQAPSVCEMCGETPDRELDVHHIIPVASGGTNGDWNLMALCRSCHRTVEVRTKEFTEPHLLKFVE